MSVLSLFDSVFISIRFSFRSVDSVDFKVQIKITMKIRLQSLQPKLENTATSEAKLRGRTRYLLIPRFKPYCLHICRCATWRNLAYFQRLGERKSDVSSCARFVVQIGVATGRDAGHSRRKAWRWSTYVSSRRVSLQGRYYRRQGVVHSRFHVIFRAFSARKNAHRHRSIFTDRRFLVSCAWNDR